MNTDWSLGGQMRNRIALAILTIAFSISFTGAEKAMAEPVYETIDCGFKMTGIDLTCGFVEVPENRAKPDGRKIPVHFVRAGATGDAPLPDPIVYLGGGPGMHATLGANTMIWGNRARLVKRDLIVVDQRGTGHSNPLDCFDHGTDAGADVVRQLFSHDFFDAETFRACMQELLKKADLTQYTTTASVEDIEEIRRALGYEKINLSGGSYGTRWALEYMRRRPESVRSAVLYGVAPPSELLVERVARDFQRNLDALIVACESDDVCSREYPEFHEQLDRILQAVKEKPVEVTVRVGDKKVPVTMNYEQLVTAMRFTFYSVHQAAALPSQVQAAAGGDYRPFADNLTATSIQLHNIVAEGLWASVKCAEELPFIDYERAKRLSGGTVLGTLRLESEREICSIWPRGAIPKDFNQPVESDVAALLIAGEFDPATPLDLAEETVRHLSNGLLVRVANRSHWGLRGSCIDGIVDRFLETGSVEGIDVDCASKFERPPFTVN
jgi:pimeloyl-ACP methyl ester carboxylesterase